MSQATAPVFIKGLPNTSGWRDVDFYRIKLVCDRVDGIGFWYYSTHLRQAWRDFWLWRKFDKLVKEKPKTKLRVKTCFKLKKKTEKVEIKKELAETKEQVETKKEKISQMKKDLRSTLEDIIKDVDEKDKKS